MRACLDCWRDILFQHLDQEVSKALARVTRTDLRLKVFTIGRGPFCREHEEILDFGGSRPHHDLVHIDDFLKCARRGPVYQHI